MNALTRETLVSLLFDVTSSPVFVDATAQELEDYTRCVFALNLPKGLPPGLTQAAMEWGVAQVVRTRAEYFNG
jgi:hypothetical protein